MAEADDARQQVRRAHVGAAQADLREDEAEPGGGGGDPQIGRARDHRPGADRGAIDRGDDRPPARAHRLDQPPGRAGERQQRRRIAAEQVLDDVVLISARAEAAAAPGDHDRADLVLAVELLEALGELAVDLERQRVQPLRPVEREGRNAARELEAERARRDHGPPPMYAVAWISTSASGSTSALIATSVIEI